MATGWFSVGPGRPLVTVPILRPSLLCSSVCSRTGTPSSATRPTRLRGRLAGLSIWASTLSAPGKPPAPAPPPRRPLFIAPPPAPPAAAPLLYRPVQRRFGRGGAAVDVVAVQAQAGFQPQRVARPQAYGPDLGLRQQGPRQALGLRCRQRKLEAVLAGVAAAGHQAVTAGDGVVAAGHEAQFLHARRQARQRRDGQRALQREQGLL